MKSFPFAVSLFSASLLAAGLFAFSPAFVSAAQPKTGDASTQTDTSTGTPPPGGPNGGPPPGGRNTAVDAALAACAQSLGASQGAPPDPAKMDACMSAKGFQKPAGPPPGGAPSGKGPPPQPKTSGES